MKNWSIEAAKQMGTGLAFVIFPLVFVFAFAIHPNLFSLEIVGDASARVAEFHGNRLMHFGHAMMLLTVPLLIIVSLDLMRRLSHREAWLGFVGAVLAVFGAVMLAVDKTALCLVPSALDTLPETQFADMLPGIQAMFSLKGWLALLYLLPLLPIGFLIQGIGLYRARAIARWQSVFLIVAMVLLGVAAAIDIDLFGLVASILLTIAFVPLGIRLIAGSGPTGAAFEPRPELQIGR